MPYSVREGDFDAMESEWESFLPGCASDTVFATPWLQRIWWSHFGQGWRLRITSVRDNDTLLGLAPLMQRNGDLRLLGDTDLFDYTDFIVPEATTGGFYEALLDHLDDEPWHTLTLKSIPEASPTLRELPRVVEGRGLACELKEEDKAPVVSLPSTWDEYLAGLSKKGRHELRRKLRRLEKAGDAHQLICSNPETLAGCMKEFFRLHRASSQEKDEFLTPEREGFFSEAALELARRGQFKLFFLELDGERVACCICFDYGDTYFLYNSGYDPGYSALSVGLLNKALTIKEAIEAGRQSFDFLRGAERYKYDLGGQDRSVYEMTIRR